MKNLFTVMKFTIKDMVRKKSFIISTILILLLIVGAFSVPKIISNINGGDNKEKVLIADNENIFEGTLEQVKELNSEKYNISIENATFDEIKEKIKNEQINSAIILERENNKIKIKYVVENARFVDQAPEELIKSISATYTNLQIGKLGLSQEQLVSINPEYEMSVEQTKDEEVDQGNVFIMMALSFALSMAIIFFTAQVSTSITTEKTSKIMETLVTSTSPRTIVLGKTLGIGLVGLFQVILVLTTALISANVFLEPEMLAVVLDMSNITPGFIAITITYFILGYFTYALLYALTGSLVSKPEDIQSANTPVSLIAMIGFYLGYFSLTIDPTSSLNSFASICPISSPFCMPSRVMMGLASGWDIALSIGILVITVLIVARIAIKVYSNAILNYGSKMSLKDAFKLYKQK